MNRIQQAMLLGASAALFACSTPSSEFGVYRQSDGLVGVHAPKSAKENEAHDEAVKECKKLGKLTATIVDTRPTVNDRFPMTYLYICR
ncbi:hypothetical protein SAMN06295945_1680 [Polynucleobacter meluiroseus]|uniref:Lipoprotein n=1 Tax=Polynucleobacter meluiroseus TaxID=1938814 RepID=A0A240E363_9BURK|nr:hypothetical protein [Polynucleobacter meluiroseus]SNX29310.1 hypothetical protein SAMN06295945_1680 [Polynucleobacter meluiroseus]